MNYQLSIVSYFDILGMKQLLTKAGKDAEKIAAILRLFKTLSEPDQGSKDEWGWSFANFSDLIIRSVPIMSDANKKYRIGLMYHEVTDACNVQANLIARGVLVRGSMTVGNIVVEQGLAFGEGLAQAYLQESTKARYPRVIIDPRLMNLFRRLYLLRRHPKFGEEWSYIRPYLSRDVDGAYFINYLGYIRENEKSNRYAEFLALHKSIVIGKWNELGGDRRTAQYRSRREKVRWLVKYH